MVPGIARSDWREAGAYAPLRIGGRHCFAWEWLRRSPAYVAAWQAGQGSPETFGLLHFENPAHNALAARPFWRRDLDRGVLCAEILADAAGDLFDLRRLEGLFAFLPGDQNHTTEHILLSDGPRAIRIDLLSGSLAAGPVRLRWHIDGVTSARPRLLALRQFVALAKAGRFARSLHRPERRARRWIDALRVHDAIAAGASHREIVSGLFGIDVDGPRWRAAAGPWRLRVQRLATNARHALAAGPALWFG